MAFACASEFNFALSFRLMKNPKLLFFTSLIKIQNTPQFLGVRCHLLEKKKAPSDSAERGQGG